MKRQTYILGGGTFQPIRNHLALCAPAFGTTAKTMKELKEQIKEFEKNNPLKFNFEEVTPDSPIGLAILGRDLNDVCVMTLPLTQGGESLVKILEIQ